MCCNILCLCTERRSALYSSRTVMPWRSSSCSSSGSLESMRYGSRFRASTSARAVRFTSPPHLQLREKDQRLENMCLQSSAYHSKWLLFCVRANRRQPSQRPTAPCAVCAGSERSLFEHQTHPAAAFAASHRAMRCAICATLRCMCLALA